MQKGNFHNYHFLLLNIIFITLCSMTLNSKGQNLNKPFLSFELLPVDLKKQIHVVNNEFKFAYGMRQDSVMRDIRNYTQQDIETFIHSRKDYEYIFRIPFWAAMDSVRYSWLIPKLINDLTDTTFVGLINANDITIWSRVKSGDMAHNTLNYQIDDDIFTVAGRASWVLKRLSKNEFGIIKLNMQNKELKAIQNRWIKWYNTLIKK